MVIRMFRNFIGFTINPIAPMRIIGNKLLNGRKSMKRTAKDRIRKVYLSG